MKQCDSPLERNTGGSTTRGVSFKCDYGLIWGLDLRNFGGFCMKYTKEDFLLEKSEKPEWKDVQWEDVDPLQEAKRKQALQDRIQELEDMYPNGCVDDY